MRQKRLKTERVPKTNLPFCFTKNLAGQFWLTVLCTRKSLCDKTPLQPLWPKFSLYSWSIFYVITLTIFISRFCGKNNRTTEKANSPLEWFTPKISTTNDAGATPHPPNQKQKKKKKKKSKDRTQQRMPSLIPQKYNIHTTLCHSASPHDSGGIFPWVS